MTADGGSGQPEVRQRHLLLYRDPDAATCNQASAHPGTTDYKPVDMFHPGLPAERGRHVRSFGYHFVPS